MLAAILARRKTRAAFDALNRHDLKALLVNYADEVTFVYPGTLGPAGVHRGRDEVRALLQRIFEQFPRIDFRVKHVALANAWDILGNNVAYTHWDLHLTNRAGTDARFSGVTAATIRHGRVVLIEDFFDASSEEHRRSWST